MDRILILLFRAHDTLAEFLAAHMMVIKRVLLIVGHLAIFGFLFPELRKNFGEQALNILLFLLFLSPLSRIFRMRLLLILMGYRRQLGIIMAYFATVHGVGYLLDFFWFQILTGWLFFWPLHLSYVVGMIAYILTLPLLFTSNDMAMKLLGKNWKRIHFLVYGVFVFAIIHKFTVEKGFSDTVSLLMAAAVIIFYLTLKFWSYRGLPNLLLKFPEVIAARYKEYVLQKNLLATKSKTIS